MSKRSSGAIYAVSLILVIVNVAAVALTLASGRRGKATENDAVTEHALLSNDLALLARLNALADAMKEPVADVLLSHGTRGDAARVREAALRFENGRAQARKTLLQRKDPEATLMLRVLDQGDGISEQMTVSAERIFVQLALGQTEDVASEVARMDASLATLRSHSREAAVALRARLHTHFAEHAAAADRFAARQSLISIVLLLVSAIVAAYGVRLIRELVVLRDRKQNETQLRQEQRQLRRKDALLSGAQRVARLGSWERDFVTGRTTWSEEMYYLTGLDPSSKPSVRNYLNLLPADDRAMVKAKLREAIVNGQERVSMRYRLNRPDGRVLVVDTQCAFEYLDDGRPSRFLGTIQDVTERVATEEALRMSQERFAFAALATHDVIWDWDVRTDRVWVSDAFESNFGYASSGFVDVSQWLQAIHPDDVERASKHMTEVLESKIQFWSADYRFRTAQGEWRDVYDRGYVLRDKDGQPVRMIGAMMDITERVRAQNRIADLSRRNELVLNATADGMIGLDSGGRITFLNPAAATMLGLQADDAIGTLLHDRVHPSRADDGDAPSAECALQAALGSTVAGSCCDEQFRRQDGTFFPVELSVNPMHDETGVVVGAVMTFRDISARRAMEKLKDEFVSTVSHELRTPLTAVRGALGLVSSGRLGTLPEKAVRPMEIAVVNTDRLVKLINDILDIERLESGRITLMKRAHEPRVLVEQSVQPLQPLLEKARVAVEIDTCDDAVLADGDRIVQTLTNLLSNAIKFSPAGSTIRVRTARGMNDTVLFSVADEGRGVPADKADAIFERFQQVDASDAREKGGSGLGLAICRSIIRQHGGEIWVSSEPGHGATFSFSLSAVRKVVPKEGSPVVLVCGDDDNARETIHFVLGYHGFAVQGARSGSELLDLLRDEHPDAILLDVALPDMNGWEVLARIKGNPRTASLPVVMTGAVSRQMEEDPFGDIREWLRSDRDVAPRMRRVIVVEDDLELASIVAGSFERHGIETIHAATGTDAVALATKMQPDLVALDLLLPDGGGIGVVDCVYNLPLPRATPLIVYSPLGRHVPSERFATRLAALLDSITRQHPRDHKGGLCDVA